MKQVTTTLLSLLISLLSYAQSSTIMVCNSTGTTCTPYANIDSAIQYATPGQFIYLPGGVFVINLPIDKEIHLIGAGHSGDSSMITGTTIINGHISLGEAASNASFEGLYLTGNFYGPTTPALMNVSFRHCHFHLIGMHLTNSSIYGCIIRSTGIADNYFYSGTYNTISNTYITNISYLSSSTVNQCTGLNHFNSVSLSTIKNSICSTYPNSPYGQPGSNNSVYNLAYVNSCPYACIGVDYTSNLLNVPIGNLYANGMSYSDMQLVANSPALTAGENGMQLGVFGGLFPYKEGAVPGNPHIFYKNISASTNANGELPVQIKVRAENY